MSKPNKIRSKAPSAVEVQRALHSAVFEEKFVILQGNPIDGLSVIGPFHEVEDAQEFAKNLKDTFFIADLIDPNDDTSI